MKRDNRIPARLRHMHNARAFQSIHSLDKRHYLTGDMPEWHFDQDYYLFLTYNFGKRPSGFLLSRLNLFCVFGYTTRPTLSLVKYSARVTGELAFMILILDSSFRVIPPIELSFRCFDEHYFRGEIGREMSIFRVATEIFGRIPCDNWQYGFI